MDPSKLDEFVDGVIYNEEQLLALLNELDVIIDTQEQPVNPTVQQRDRYMSQRMHHREKRKIMDLSRYHTKKWTRTIPYKLRGDQCKT